jgi:ring-1,2-phenylacetyl-CoA epoxidase subunit PaaE
MDNRAPYQYKTLRVAAVNDEAPDFKTFVFEPGHGLAYKSGQYLTLALNEPEAIRRSYSITSAPALQEPLAIGVKRIANGTFSRYLFDRIGPGSELHTIGAGGLFVLPENISDYRQVFFFAAGSGITPILSLLKTALHAHPHLSVVLIYSNPSPERALFLQPVQQLHEQFGSRFHLELLFSNNPNLYRARLHRDLILEWLKTLVYPGRDATLFYTCGPESYMRLCVFTLQAQGIPAAHIKRENFITHTHSAGRILPPDAATHTAWIRKDGVKQAVAVAFPESILKAAKKAGMQLPFSCEVGRCGNCVAHCTSGTVWHSYNEVLTERELQQGLVLTCVAHPVGGDVVLEIK